MQREAAIVGIGRTAYSRASGRTPAGMAADVDGVVDFNTGDSVRAQQLGWALGVDDLSWALDVSGGGNVASSTVATAFAAVSRGLCDVAVVYRSLNGRSGARYG